MPVARSRRVACAAAVITCVMLAAAGGPALADTTPAPTTPGPNPAAQVVLTQADLPSFSPDPNPAQNYDPFPPCSQGNALIGGLGSSPNAVNGTDFGQASTNAQGSTNNFLLISSAALGADTVDQAHATFTVLASATFLSCITQQAQQYYNSTSLSVTLTPQPSHSPSTGDESTDLRLNLAGTWPDGEPLTAVLDFTVIRIQKMIALLEVGTWAVTGQDQPFPDGEVKLLDGLLASRMTSLQAPSPTGPTSGPGQTAWDCNPHLELDLRTAVEVPGFKALGGLSLSAEFTVGKVQICDHDMTPAASPPNDSHPLTLQVGGGLPTGAAATPGPNYAWLFHPFDYSLIHAAWTGPGVNLPSHLAPSAPKLELGPTITLSKGMLSKGGPALKLGSITEEFTPENFDLISNGPAALRTNLGPSVSLALEVTPASLAERWAAAKSMTSDAATAEKVVADGIAQDATLATEEQVSEYYVTSIQMPSFASPGFGPSIYAGVDRVVVVELAAPENAAYFASLADLPSVAAPAGEAVSLGEVSVVDEGIAGFVDGAVSLCEVVCWFA